ncbi:MAG: hypothetical protein IJ833_03435 [Lachnospiraceae bacterium]|nr:hypothetical protein [Lachnospiraceae bacterium]
MDEKLQGLMANSLLFGENMDWLEDENLCVFEEAEENSQETLTPEVAQQNVDEEADEAPAEPLAMVADRQKNADMPMALKHHPQVTMRKSEEKAAPSEEADTFVLDIDAICEYSEIYRSKKAFGQFMKRQEKLSVKDRKMDVGINRQQKKRKKSKTESVREYWKLSMEKEKKEAGTKWQLSLK